MRTGKEGKLLARAAAFYHPGGTKRKTEPTYSALNFSFIQKKCLASCVGPDIPFRPHQGEREKNEYS
jgi:hypothetical protein